MNIKASTHRIVTGSSFVNLQSYTLINFSLRMFNINQFQDVFSRWFQTTSIYTPIPASITLPIMAVTLIMSFMCVNSNLQGLKLITHKSCYSFWRYGHAFQTHFCDFQHREMFCKLQDPCQVRLSIDWGTCAISLIKLWKNMICCS